MFTPALMKKQPPRPALHKIYTAMLKLSLLSELLDIEPLITELCFLNTGKLS